MHSSLTDVGIGLGVVGVSGIFGGSGSLIERPMNELWVSRGVSA